MVAGQAATWGNPNNPLTYGGSGSSAGGTNSGGSGGGIILINAGTLSVGGTIDASGAMGITGYAPWGMGGGAGGLIFINATSNTSGITPTVTGATVSSSTYTGSAGVVTY